jgi:hypothetical protein
VREWVDAGDDPRYFWAPEDEMEFRELLGSGKEKEAAALLDAATKKAFGETKESEVPKESPGETKERERPPFETKEVLVPPPLPTPSPPDSASPPLER